MESRKLGNASVSPIGMGCWAIGGPFWEGNQPLGWGEVDDNTSIKAIHAALEAGINLIDTADAYGAGHSERVIAKALAGKRDNVVLATKCGFTFNETTKQATGPNGSPDYIEQAVLASLKRLNTDYLDLVWFHLNDFPTDQADAVAEAFERLVQSGKINAYGWSTDFPDRAEVFAKHPNCAAFQFDLNIFTPNPMLNWCEKNGYSGVNRGPLAMGLLSGKYNNAEQLSMSDVRRISPEWMKYFKDGVPSPEMMSKYRAIKDILTSKGRTSVQGALAWLWAKSPVNIPIPGFRTPEQILESAKAMEFGPLTEAQMSEIETLMS